MCVPSILWRPFPVGKEPFSKADVAVVSYGMLSSRMRCLCVWDGKSPMWCLWASLCAVLWWCKTCPGFREQIPESYISLEGNLKPIQSNPLPWAGTPLTTPGVSKPHPAWVFFTFHVGDIEGMENYQYCF